MLSLIHTLCIVGILTWLITGVHLATAKLFNGKPLPAARTLFHELRPFFLPMVFASFVLDAYLSGDVVERLEVLQPADEPLELVLAQGLWR
jgi:hypothetical protein